MSRRLAALVGGVAVVLSILLVQISTGNRASTAQPTAVAHPAIIAMPAAPATQAADNATLPAEFAVLQTHSPFGHGHHHSPGAEDSFVFKGVMQSDDRFTAFLQDMSTKQVVQLAAGDAVAHGRIKTVDLDSIEYETTGKSLRVEVGQNLMGQVVPPTPTSQPAAPPPSGDAAQAGPPEPTPDQSDGPPPQPGPRRGRVKR